MSANDKQVGGTHYKNPNGIPDHWDIVVGMGWDYLLGNATKYIWRLGRKGPPEKAIEDLDKAMHYLAKKRELLVKELAERPSTGLDTPCVLAVPPESVYTLGDVISRKMANDGSNPTRKYLNQD